MSGTRQAYNNRFGGVGIYIYDMEYRKCSSPLLGLVSCGDTLTALTQESTVEF